MPHPVRIETFTITITRLMRYDDGHRTVTSTDEYLIEPDFDGNHWLNWHLSRLLSLLDHTTTGVTWQIHWGPRLIADHTGFLDQLPENITITARPVVTHHR